jgi:hypothetical protein|tara:strand:+ start:909 stop:1025 length:117 start_codon:yes stop_codon:yes gene_type:complete
MGNRFYGETIAGKLGHLPFLFVHLSLALRAGQWAATML